MRSIDGESIPGHVLAIIARWQCLSVASAQGLKIERLPGQTNVNYRITTPDNVYVLRIPGKGTEKLIDRAGDEHNSRIAAEIGVSTRIVHIDRESGVMLREYVDGRTMTEASFLNADNIVKVANALRAIHSSGREFSTHFDILAKIDDYTGMLRACGGPLPWGYERLAMDAGRARPALDLTHVELKPCHNDLVTANFIDVGDRCLVLDWEYSGMNDPLFDLGAFASEARLTPDREDLLLGAYFDAQVPSGARLRMRLHQVMWTQWNTLWAMVQIAQSRTEDNYWEWGIEHFRRCHTTMESDEFSHFVRSFMQEQISR